MKENFSRSLAMLLRHEGGFVNHPKDPGGMTNRGITKKVYDKFLGRESTEEDMRNIPDRHVEEIYKTNYWDKIKGDDLPSGVDLCIFDWAVNSGCGRAAKSLQKVIGTKQDGGIGPITLKAINELDADDIITNVSKERENFYRSLKTFKHFGKGWLKRNMETKNQALTITD